MGITILISGTLLFTPHYAEAKTCQIIYPSVVGGGARTVPETIKFEGNVSSAGGWSSVTMIWKIDGDEKSRTTQNDPGYTSILSTFTYTFENAGTTRNVELICDFNNIASDSYAVSLRFAEIDWDQYCRETFGSGYYYDASTDLCLRTAAGNDQYCKEKFGSDRYYNANTDSCERTFAGNEKMCKERYDDPGASYNASTNECVRSPAGNDQYCKEKFGSDRYYDASTNMCVQSRTFVPTEPSQTPSSPSYSPSYSSDIFDDMFDDLFPIFLFGAIGAIVVGIVGSVAKAKSKKNPEIEKWNLSPTAKKAAYMLKKKFPDVKFISGKRTLEEQLRAMANNVAKQIKKDGNRNHILDAYVKDKSTDPHTLKYSYHQKLHDWVINHEEAKTAAEIKKGLVDTASKMSTSDQARISKHLHGDAFDIEPPTKNVEEIKEFIDSLPGKSEFLTKEGGLVRWHIQF